MQIALIKTDEGLRPVHNKDQERISKLKFGTPYLFEIKRPRRLLHHRKFWAILNLVSNNSNGRWTPEKLLIALKIKLGYYNIFQGFDDREIIHTGSIRFEVMDQDTFERFYDLSLPVLADEAKCSVADLEDNYQSEL